MLTPSIPPTLVNIRKCHWLHSNYFMLLCHSVGGARQNKAPSLYLKSGFHCQYLLPKGKETKQANKKTL